MRWIILLLFLDTFVLGAILRNIVEKNFMLCGMPCMPSYKPLPPTGFTPNALERPSNGDGALAGSFGAGVWNSVTILPGFDPNSYGNNFGGSFSGSGSISGTGGSAMLGKK